MMSDYLAEHHPEIEKQRQENEEWAKKFYAGIRAQIKQHEEESPEIERELVELNKELARFDRREQIQLTKNQENRDGWLVSTAKKIEQWWNQ